MKKFFRVTVPLLLAIAVIGSLVWYLFVYDRDFTRDMLLSTARHFESSGSHKVAAWLYDLTYDYADQDDDVAIELARQYKAAGNYSKAEYTLSNAIRDGGGKDLYVELCKTYVEQDKLLDAVNMLDNIAVPEIKEALDGMRPSTPTADIPPDFYNEYLSVTLSGEDGTLYATTNGEYPSTAQSPCTQPIEIGSGVTTVWAVSVGSNGLVSPLGTFSYTVNGVIEPVVFADPVFEEAIRSTLDVDADETIYSNTLWDITEFAMPLDSKDYSDLRWLPYLQTLYIEEAVDEQLVHLNTLTYLNTLTLHLSAPSQTSLEMISKLPALKSLTLTSCGLSSITPLQSATGLKYLNLADNTVRNISALSSMTQLEQLYISSNALTDLSALSNLTLLTDLDVSYNALNSIAPICSNTALQTLNVSNNNLTDLSSINLLSSLTELYAANNAIADVSKLSACTKLQQLDISHNSIADITALSPLNELVRFDFSYNQAAQLPAWDKTCALVTIDGSYNLLSSLAELGGLSRLNNVLMDYNEAIEDLTPLKDCHLLVQVNVYGTKVTDVSFLTDQKILVNFNPTLEQN
ncbi:MAG: leucine-rich repeat domain-containing protein [Oscillospiraceae bacterium]|nr:leucine-rich repeat domain-containing protein [Oscillospiraceae bacterium]